MKKITSVDFDQLSSEAICEIDKIIRKDQLIQAITEELHTSARYRDFFDHYSDESVHQFIKEYAKKKAFYLLHGKKAIEQQQDEELRFRLMAEKYFEEIQQKKLFDLQCLWRAGKTEIEDVWVTRDFHALEFRILSLTFLKPVTVHELDIYLDYLHSDESVQEHHYRWQDYDHYKKAIETGNENLIPAWFRFHDKAIGADSLLGLDDIKGEKEKALLSRLSAFNAQQGEPILSKPELELNFPTLEFFVFTFEDRPVLRAFSATERRHPDIENNGAACDAFNMLMASEEEIALTDSGNWKQSLIETANQYRKKKVATALKEVFKEYTLRLKAGIPYPAGDNNVYELYAGQAALYREKIIAARRAAGEPADFNY